MDLSKLNRAIGATLGAWLFMVACTGAPGPSEPGHELGTDPESRSQFEQCLTQAGYTEEELRGYEELVFPPPGESRDIRDGAVDPQLQAAFQRCGVANGIVEVDGDEPEEVAAQNEITREATRCMNDRGWDVEPKTDSDRPGMVFPVYDWPTDPEEARAFNRDYVECLEGAGVDGLEETEE